MAVEVSEGAGQIRLDVRRVGDRHPGIAQRLVGDGTAEMGKLRPACIALDRHREQAESRAGVALLDHRRALVEIGFGLVRIESDRPVEIGDREIDLRSAKTKNAAIDVSGDPVALGKPLFAQGDIADPDIREARLGRGIRPLVT